MWNGQFRLKKIKYYLSDAGGFDDLVEQCLPGRLLLDRELQLALERRDAHVHRHFRHFGESKKSSNSCDQIFSFVFLKLGDGTIASSF